MEREDHVKTYCICEKCAKECGLGNRVDSIVSDRNGTLKYAYCGNVSDSNRYGLTKVKPVE